MFLYDEGGDGWSELEDAVVPAGTKRDTVVRQAAANQPLEAGETLLLMVIPKEFAIPVRVTLEQPDPQLRIG